MIINGKCHCANIAFDFHLEGEPQEIPARACACSFCVKHGGVWTAAVPSKLVVTIQDAALVSQYTFGTRTAIFHLCSRCGVVPFATSEINGRVYAVVSVNVFENLDRARLRRSSANFDHEDVEARLLRRSRGWIADVRILHG